MPRETIVWPDGLNPDEYPIRSYNELFVPASPEAIWRQLLDATRWPDWYKNAHNVRITGTERVLGPTTEFVWKTFGVTVQSRVLVFEPFLNIGWDAREMAGWNGFHGWKILPRDGGCLVITEEVQRGLLAGTVKGRIEKGLLREHQRWLEGLARQTAAAGSSRGVA
jgi:Polyketide cyclase / dehydrase and lipid transport